VSSTVDSLRATVVEYPEPHDAGRMRYLTFVRLESADGAVGWGECIAQFREAAFAVKAMIDNGLAELVLGRDPLEVRQITEDLRARAFWTGNGGIASFAISGIDMALWDLAGKLRGVPVHALLGGQVVKRAVACASVILNTLDLEATAEQFGDYVARGYTSVKGGWGQVPEAGFGTDAVRDVAIAETIRRAVGENTMIALDVSARARWDATRACQMAERLADAQLAWLEDPLPHTDLDGYRRLRAAAPMALATGERCWTVADYRLLYESGTLDIVLIDPGRVDGITGMWEAATSAAAHGIRLVPHSWSSAINTAAALHVFAAVPNGHVFELKPHPSPMQNELVSTPFDQVDGWIEIPQAPGLGVEVDEDVVAGYAVTGV
jgi:L-alanine-DL-glutamate epimerase-like enolase superfamily enzyme